MKQGRTSTSRTLAGIFVLLAASAWGVEISNGIPQGTLGSWTVDVNTGGEIPVESGGAVLTAQPLGSTDLVTGNVVYFYGSFVEVGDPAGPAVHELSSGSAPTPPDPDFPNIVTSSGSFLNAANTTINWTVTSSILPNNPVMINVITFTPDSSQAMLGPLRFFQYLDEDVVSDVDDVFFTRGSLAAGNLQLFTVDQTQIFGVAQSGVLSPAFGQLIHATFAGWAAGTFDNMEPRITSGTQSVDLAGLVQDGLSTVQVPPVGTAYGPADIVSVLAWDVDPTASSAIIVTTLGGVPSAAAIGGSCGDGMVDSSEACDRGSANGSPGSCCNSDCQLVPAGTTCRPSAGACDVAETCTGESATCPADGFASATTVCRPSTGGCDAAGVCTGQSTECPPDSPAAAGTVCRPAAGPCDNAERCDGLSTSCPPDATKLDGDPCDDGDPETGTSVCLNQVCVGVTTTVAVPPDITVPPGKPPGKVKIPVHVEIPAGAGSSNATVLLQGTVDCLDLPVSVRPKRCGAAGGTTSVYQARLETVFLPVTPRIKRALGRTQARSLTIGLSLTPLGQRLFAKLKPDEQTRTLSVQVASKVQDRHRRTIEAVFPVLLARRR